MSPNQGLTSRRRPPRDELDKLLGVDRSAQGSPRDRLDRTLGIEEEKPPKPVEPADENGLYNRAKKGLQTVGEDISKTWGGLGRTAGSAFTGAVSHTGDLLKGAMERAWEARPDKLKKQSEEMRAADPSLRDLGSDVAGLGKKLSDYYKPERFFDQEKVAQTREDYPIASRVAGGIGQAPVDLAKLAGATAAGGPVLGFGALGGAESYARGDDTTNILANTAKDMLVGKIFKGIGGVSRPVKAGALATLGGTQSAIEGGSAEDIIAGGITLPAIALPGSKPGGTTARQLSRNIKPTPKTKILSPVPGVKPQFDPRAAIERTVERPGRTARTMEPEAATPQEVSAYTGEPMPVRPPRRSLFRGAKEAMEMPERQRGVTDLAIPGELQKAVPRRKAHVEEPTQASPTDIKRYYGEIIKQMIKPKQDAIPLPEKARGAMPLARPTDLQPPKPKLKGFVQEPTKATPTDIQRFYGEKIRKAIRPEPDVIRMEEKPTGQKALPAPSGKPTIEPIEGAPKPKKGASLLKKKAEPKIESIRFEPEKPAVEPKPVVKEPPAPVAQKPMPKYGDRKVVEKPAVEALKPVTEVPKGKPTEAPKKGAGLLKRAGAERTSGKYDLKEQKAYLIDALKEAKKKAPEVADRSDIKTTGRDVGETKFGKTDMVEIKVPDDGTFKVINDQTAINNMMAKVKKSFPEVESRGRSLKKVKQPSIKPSVKRLSADEIEFFNPYKAKKQGIVEVKGEPERNKYADGYYTNGHYLLKTEKPAKVSVTEMSKEQTSNMRAILDKKVSEAKITGEMKYENNPQNYVLVEGGGQKVFLNANYVDSVMSKHPKAKPFMGKTPTDAVMFKVGNENVGAIMPLREPGSLKPFQTRIQELKGSDLKKNETAVGYGGKEYTIKGEPEKGKIEKKNYVYPKTKEGVLQDIKGTAVSVADAAAEGVDQILKIFAPAARGKKAKFSANVLRGEQGKVHVDYMKAERALKEAKKYFDSKTDAEITEFIDNGERGRPQKDTRIQKFSDTMETIVKDRREKIQRLGKGKLVTFHKHYFPRIWDMSFKDAGSKVRNLFSRDKKPLEGGKSFLKRRSFEFYKDAIDAGLRPKSRNPVDTLIHKVQEMDQFIIANSFLDSLKESHNKIFVPATGKSKPPKSWVRLPDEVGTVYGPPERIMPEYVDKSMYNGLLGVAKKLGVKHERKAGFGRKKALGLAYKGSKKVETQYATELSVLAHEIGHQLDFKYDLWNTLFKRESGKGFKPGRSEFRAIAELTGDRPGATKKVEKMAQVVEAYVHAPARMKEVAPRAFEEFEKFLEKHPDVKGLKDIRPGIELEKLTTDIDLGGYVLKGHWYVPEEIGTVINNYLKKGLREKSGIYRGAMEGANLLNQVTLGMSGFHAVMTTVTMMESKWSTAMNKIAKKQYGSAVKDIITAPAAPIEALREGTKLYKEALVDGTYPELRPFVEMAMEGGHRFEVPSQYKSQFAKRMIKALKKGNVVTAALNSPFALIEAAAWPTMQWLVPRYKSGLFMKLARMEMKKHPNMTPEMRVEKAAKIIDTVDNRLGQLVYDNIFWNKTAKDIGHLLVRSVGWNLGSFRELLGAGKDLTVNSVKAAMGKKSPTSYRIAYPLAMLAFDALLGATLTYTFTGEGPKEWRDYFYPRNGETDEDGKPMRIVIPSYTKDIFAYGIQPGSTILHKANPLVTVAWDMLQNEDFFNTEIRHANDPFVKQLKDLAEFGLKEAQPFSIQGYKQQREKGMSVGKSLMAPFGFPPAPQYITKSAAEKKATDFVVRKLPQGSRTKQEFKEAQERKDIRRSLKKGDRNKLIRAEREGRITERQKTTLEADAKLTNLQRLFKRLALEDAVEVYRVATKEERRKLYKVLRKKYKSKMKSATPAQKAKYKELVRGVSKSLKKGGKNE